MATTAPKEKRRRLTETLLLLLAVICWALIITDISINTLSEINTTTQTVIVTQGNIEATAEPGLTGEQYQDSLGPEDAGNR